MNTSTTPRSVHAVAKGREIKAQAILRTVAHFVTPSLRETTWLDIGCGNGGIAATLAPHVKSITGVDPEPWVEWADFQKHHLNLHFLTESVEELSCPTASVDIVVCNQVYEHVPNPQLLIAQIARVLKPGGHCYFAGPNLLFPIEPHVLWPCVHWLPRPTAVKLLHFCGSKGILDAYSTDYWTLKKWLRAFDITNAVPYILKNPSIYGRESWGWRLLAWIPAPLLSALTPLSPTFVFILQKPGA